MSEDDDIARNKNLLTMVMMVEELFLDEAPVKTQGRI
jgi:hypothetical protein